MKKIILTLFLIGFVTLSYAQEEFYRPEGGMTLGYGHSVVDEDNFNSLGLGFVLKNGFAFGVSSQPIGDETKPQLYIGYLSKCRDKNSYLRPHIQLSYVGSSLARIISGNLGLSYLINSKANFPTSLNGIVSINHAKYKERDGSYMYFGVPESELMPVAGLMLHQAFFSHHTLTPVIGAGVAHNLQHNNTSFSFTIGVNVNFGGSRI